MSNNKVLIITYYWPPAGGPGVQRWLNFVKYLPKFNIEPIVFCPLNPNYPIVDQSLSNDVPKGVNVIKHPIFEPYRFANVFSKSSTKSMSSGLIPKQKKQSFIQKLLLFVRGNFFIPDSRVYWVKPSVKFLKSYINEHQINTIITTGPPHSVHLIGSELKKRMTLNWITDFRDPWTTIGYHKDLKLMSFSKTKHLKLEQQVLNKSDLIITTSNHTKKEFQNKTKTTIEVITNGFDEKEIKSVEKDACFSLSHIGSLLSERNPIILWEVLSELIGENKEFKTSFQLNLAGVVSHEIIETINKYNLIEHTNCLGYISHQDALVLQRQSQMLLLVEINSNDTKAIIPGKLFEYLYAQTPILALGPKNSDVCNIIQTTNCGHYFTYDDKKTLKNEIIHSFEKFKQGTLRSKATNFSQFSRVNLTSKLADVISNSK